MNLRYDELIKQMTLEEKASMTSGGNFWNTVGIERLGIPPMMLTDGPHGLRKQGGKADALGLNQSIPATCFPTSATLANSWDYHLTEAVGRAVGEEAAAEEVGVVLGPGLNIVRDPRSGRAFEYFSEDPLLAGKLAAGLVRGIQSTGVAACMKHYAVNSQEHMRMNIDEIVDERALREIYLEGFRYVVAESGVKSVMSSYNKVNGTYANENMYLLRDILKGEWGFDGLIVTDWGAENDRVAGLLAGNQLEMPSSSGMTVEDVMEAVKSGELDESTLDERIDELLAIVFETHRASEGLTKVDFKAHHELAAEAARRSIVLLKNNDDILPLKPRTKVAVIGDFAETPRYQGAGSSLVKPTRLENSLDALTRSKLDVVGFATGFKRYGGHSRRRLREAVELAQSAEVALVFIGLDETIEAEGIDRANIKLPDAQLEMLEDILDVQENVVVVLCGGGPVEMPFVGQTKAVLHGFLGGQAGGQAIVDVLTGEANPSGKLAMTYPYSYRDVPTKGNYPGQEATAEHRESIFVGYRYYDTRNVPVLFPFGHGLSYTKFDYSDIEISEDSVSFTLTNVGEVAGEEITQVYVGAEESEVFRARHELKGFAKVHLQPGQSERVTISLDSHAYAYFNIKLGRWTVETGRYVVEVGASSDDIRLSGEISIKGEEAPNPYNKEELARYYKGDVKDLSSGEFEKLYGSPLPNPRWNRRRKLTVDDTPAQFVYGNWLGKFIYGWFRLARRLLFMIGRPLTANGVMFLVNMPLRKMARMSNGKISMRKVEGFIKLVR